MTQGLLNAPYLNALVSFLGHRCLEIATITPGCQEGCRMFSALAPSQKWNELPPDRDTIYRTYLLTPVGGGYRKPTPRSHSSLPCSERLWSGEPWAHPLSERWRKARSSYWRHLEEETIAAVSFSITPRDEVWDAAVQDDWITQNETEAICEPHVSCWVPGRAPFGDDRVLIPFVVWSSLKDELIVFRRRCK